MSPLTENERKEIAEIFRKLSRKENLSEKELKPGVNDLANLYGFPEDAEEFFNDCAPWFYKKEKMFAGASDGEVIRKVRNRFRGYLGDERAKRNPSTQPCPQCKGARQMKDGFVCQLCWGMGEIPKPDQVSRPEQFPPIEDDEGNRASDDDFASTGEQRKGYNTPSTSWKELAAETNYQVARERTEFGRELRALQKKVRRLRHKKDLASIAKLESEYRGEFDAQNDPELRQEHEWKARKH